jgi:CspA family cold shock protein
MAERMRGHIQQFSRQRRSGLVRPDDGYPIIWVFLSDFRSATDGSRVMPGDAVEFEVEHAPEGPMAVDVVILKNEAVMERVRGKIKWFDHRKRYGFIQRNDGLQDVFVHTNEFRSTSDVYWVRDGDTVEFKVEQTPKGPKAVDVTVLEGGNDFVQSR